MTQQMILKRNNRKAITNRRTHSLAETPVQISCHRELDAAFAKGDCAKIAEALGVFVRACGVMQVSKMTGIGRQWLYNGLTATGNPCFKMIFKMVVGLGFRLAVVEDGHTVAFDGDHWQIVKAIGNAARAKRVRIPSKKGGGRGHRLFLSLLYVGNPTLGTLTRLLPVLGYRLAVISLEQLTDGVFPVLTWRKGGKELELDSRQGTAPSDSGIELIRCLTYTRKRPLSDFIVYRKMERTDNFRELNVVLASGNFKEVTKVLDNAVRACGMGKDSREDRCGAAEPHLLEESCDIRLVNINKLLAGLGCRLVVMDGDRLLTLKDGGSGQILQILGRVVACCGWTRTAKEVDLRRSYLHLTLRSGANPVLRHLLKIVSTVGYRLAVIPLRTVRQVAYKNHNVSKQYSALT